MDNIMELSGNDIIVLEHSEIDKFNFSLNCIREEVRDNSYIEETIKVLTVGGFRSAIGSIWNAVVDDLRNKILHRSINLFNKEMNPKKQIKIYDDFQDNINDEMLLDGAYKIGVISWEAHKLLKQAKETRHIFDGHPASSNPGAIKALAMIDDCVKYVLSQEYPPQIVDINEYIDSMGTSEFWRNEYSVSDAVSDLPDIYKEELINRFYRSYINEACSAILRSNIEFVAPFLWKVLPKKVTIQIAHSIDKEIVSGNINCIQYSFAFINKVGARKYLSNNAKKYLLSPTIKKLLNFPGEFSIENQCIDNLLPYAGYIPRELLQDYVFVLTRTYIGHIGGSAQYSRTDFYADAAAIVIPEMFDKFDDESAEAFCQMLKTNELIKNRIKNHVKLNRLRTLGGIVNKKMSKDFSHKNIIESLIDEKLEKEFFNLIK